MLGELVYKRRHLATLLTYQFIATVPEQQRVIQSKHSQATMPGVPGMLGSSEHQPEQPNSQQPASNVGSCCKAGQQVSSSWSSKLFNMDHSAMSGLVLPCIKQCMHAMQECRSSHPMHGSGTCSRGGERPGRLR